MSEQQTWARLERAFRAGEPIAGTVTKIEGGFFFVDVGGGVTAGLALAHAGWRPPAHPERLVGQTLELKIVGCTPERGNVVVSRLALLQQRRAEAIDRLREGTIVEGTVKGLTPYGAFIDLGGVDGMLHRTEMSDAPPLPEPSELLAPGQRLRVRVVALGDPIQLSVRGV